MSLFICDKCGCVDNTNCNHPPYDMIGIDPDYPNMHSMEMAGFRYKEDGRTSLPRVEPVLLCSECNTGKWHGEFAKNKATDVEIEMGSQLRGDEHNVFTFHPLWADYDKDPDGFDIDILKETDLDKTRYMIKSAIKDTLSGMMGGMCETYVREEPKIGRNSDCPCGSKRKYKKCCLRRGE